MLVSSEILNNVGVHADSIVRHLLRQTLWMVRGCGFALHRNGIL